MTSPDDSWSVVKAEYGLSAQHAEFVHALITHPDMNVLAAEKAAGMSQGAGARALQDVKVRKAVGAMLMDRRERYPAIRDACMQALWALATFDIIDLVDDEEPDFTPSEDTPESFLEALGTLSGGRLKPPHKLPPELRRAVVGVKRTQYGWEYKFVNRAQVLLALLKHFGDVDRKALGQGPAPIDATGESVDGAEGVQVIYYQTDADKKLEQDK